MSKRTQIVCLREGKEGHSIDPLFIRRLIKSLNPGWIRPQSGHNYVRTVDCGGRAELIKRMPAELRACLSRGSDTTLMVWADVDSDFSPDTLRERFWKEAEGEGVSRHEFDQVVFALPQCRIENWVEFLISGSTSEATKGPRVKDAEAVRAAKSLAERCLRQKSDRPLPSSLEWSCRNWKTLVDRMK